MKQILEKIPGIRKYKKFQLVSGGISNQNYRIISPNTSKTDWLLTLYPDNKTWWKADKEEQITKIYKEHSIPSARIINSGYISYQNCDYRYLLREFVEGKDLDDFLLKKKNFAPDEWRDLLTELGTILGTLHSISMTGYGLIKGKTVSGSDIKDLPSASTWQKYVDRLMVDRGLLSERLDQGKTYGKLRGVDVQKIYKSSYELYINYRDVLKNVSQPFLIHYDMLLKNIIVKFNLRLSRWEVSAVIDNEWVSVGDPDIDLIQIENSVYFSLFRESFKKYWSFFTKAYGRKKMISKDIGKKRIIYHMIRSLFYLIEVYRTDKEEIVARNTKNIRNIEENYRFLKRLVDQEKVDFALPR